MIEITQRRGATHHQPKAAEEERFEKTGPMHHPPQQPQEQPKEGSTQNPPEKSEK
jgi:hypothetical protein